MIILDDDIRNLDPIELGHLLAREMVVVFRKPTYGLTPEEQLDIVHQIGKTPELPTDPGQLAKTLERAKEILVVPGVLRVTKGGLFGHEKELDWHANQASNKERMPIVWMYGVKGMKGSRTSFIDMIKVYETLPQDLKDRIANKKCYFGYKKGSYTDSEYFKEHISQDNLFDLVMTNQEGKTGLYFPFNQVFGMADTSDGEFEMLKDELIEYILNEDCTYHHDWEDGQIILSDQWLSIHKRWEFKHMDKRLLHRIAFDYSKVYDND